MVQLFMNLQSLCSSIFETAFKDALVSQTQKHCMIFQTVLKTFFDFTQIS